MDGDTLTAVGVVLLFGVTTTPSYCLLPLVMLAGKAYQVEAFFVKIRNRSGNERPLTVIVLFTAPAVRVIVALSVAPALTGVYSMVRSVVSPAAVAGTAVSASERAKLLLLELADRVVDSSKFLADTRSTALTFCPLALVIHCPFLALMLAPQEVV